MKKFIFVLMVFVTTVVLAEESVEILQLEVEVLKDQSTNDLPCQMIDETVGLKFKIEQVIETATPLQQDQLKQMQIQLNSLFQEQQSNCATFTDND